MRKIIILILSLALLVSLSSAATLNVPSQYKTIQRAVNAAHTGDTIYVASGTYKEYVVVSNKDIIFQGQKVNNTYKYPNVYGFHFSGCSCSKMGSGDIYGFNITKYGVCYEYGVLGSNIIKNNHFYNRGIEIRGFPCSGNTIMNNKFTGNHNYVGVNLYESQGNVIKGNTFYKARIGLLLDDSATCKSISKNVFSSCKAGIRYYILPDGLTDNTFEGNSKDTKAIIV